MLLAGAGGLGLAVVAAVAGPWWRASGTGGNGSAPASRLEARTPVPEEAELLPGATLERRLAPGETHRFRLPAAAGDFLDLVVDQDGVDLVVTLLDPAGEPVLEADAPLGDFGPEPIEAVAAADGAYRLVVRAWDGAAPPGRYRVTVRAVRPASAEDRRRAEAARLFARGEARSWAGKPREAVAFYRRAGELARDLGDVAGRAEVQDRICTALWALREAREAVTPCHASVALFRRAGDPRREAMACSNEGVVRFGLGELDAAISLYGRALELAERAGDEQTVARVHSYRGQAHQVRDEIQAALDDYAAALPAWQGRHHAADRARALQNLGVLYRLLGRPGLARDRLAAARSAWTEAGDDRGLAATLNQLGELARAEGRTDQALSLYGQALALRRDLDDRRGQAKTLEKLGLLRADLGAVSEARASLHEALDLLGRVDDPRPRASVLLALGRLDQRQGRADAALASLSEALALYRRIGDATEEAECLLGVARSERSRGDLDAALAASEEALTLVESVRARSLRQDLRTSFFATVDDHFDLAIDLLMELDRARPGRGYAARALAVAERARARSLLDGLMEAGARLRGTASPELLARERGLRERLEAAAGRRRRLADLAEGGDVLAVTAEAAERQVRELVAAIEEAQARMRAASPRYAELEAPRPPELAAIQSDLADAQADLAGPGTLLLEYRLGRERSYLWLISRDALVSAELPGRAVVEEAARRVHDLLRRSQRRETRASLDRSLCRLAETVLAPVADRLGELGPARLVVVPDGALAYVPFAALPLPASAREGSGCSPERPLLVDHEITYLPSLSTLAALRRRGAEDAPAAGVLAVVAAPAGAGLAFTRREGEAILALAPAGRRFGAFGADATKALVTSGRLRGYRIIHFATHGVLDARHPELSGLALSADGARDGDPPVFLRAHEVYDLDLPADLVVLSACETALGSEARGEGLVGLTQGFFHAGAARVVVSLWQVSDRGTAELMARFYRRLLGAGRPPAAALREAQLAMQRDERFAAPYHWAGFVLQGEWR
jgi:CHAT domain-containing protein